MSDITKKSITITKIEYRGHVWILSNLPKS
jgi:hypothetical protein